MAFTAPGSIEKPTPSDYDELTGLWEASVRATHHFLSEADIQFYRKLVRDEFLKHVDLFCIRGENRRITGFMGILGNNLEMLFIHPDNRKNGIGRLLLYYALQELGVTRVDVNEQNSEALKFYMHCGFVVIGRSETDAMGKPFPLLHLEAKSI